MRSSVENDLGSLVKRITNSCVFVWDDLCYAKKTCYANWCLCEMYIDMIYEMIKVYCENDYMCFDMFCEIKCLVDKLICVGIYDLTKRIDQRALRKGFRKTSLSHLDLCFKILIFQDQAFRPSREEGWRICYEMTPTF